MKLLRIQAVPLSKSPAKVVIRWEAQYTPGETSADFEFLVERSFKGQDGDPGFQHVDIHGRALELTPSLDPKNLSPITPWTDGAEFPWFVDYSDSLKNLTSQTFYKIKVRHKNTQEIVIETDMFTWDGDIDLVGLYVVDEHNFLLEDAIGVPCFFYQRRQSGILCEKCFDKIQKKRTSSQCTNCFGTNWTKGFYDPIDSYIDFSPNPKAIQIEQWGATQPNESNTLMSNFPDAGPGDVIRELRSGRMWRVVRVTEVEKRRCPMLQFGRVTEIKPGDIEYKLPVDEQVLLKKINELEATKKRREF